MSLSASSLIYSSISWAEGGFATLVAATVAASFRAEFVAR